MRSSIFSLTGLLVLILGASMATAGGIISGKVTCKRVRTPKDAIVYVERVDGDFPAPEEHATQDQQNIVYIPHVQAVLKGTTMDFPNSDTVRHNAFSPPGSAVVFNLGTYDVGVVKHVTFDALGETPLLCNVHAEMSGYVLTLQNPYFAVITERSGAYAINDVPPGKYTLTTWHEKLRSVSKEIEVKEGETTTTNLLMKKKK
ncbi:MAG: carboxypeptidase regulatory-like domain-containing protein [Candidatus Brocadiales bacterium]